MTSLRKIALAALLGASACSNQGSSGPSFAFSRPELLDFVCLVETGNDKFAPLPRSCCAELDPGREPGQSFDPALGSMGCKPKEEVATGQPSLHALVSQSVRGEIAAVDLADERVIDSDRVIPGATFIDSGGLPAAMVTPREHPRSPGAGPRWTYVASAEQNQIRAIANCRFRTAVACGPETVPGMTPALLARMTRLQLPGRPGDMVLAPESGPDAALWITLPELALLARIELSDDPEQPFALDESRAPREAAYYRIAPLGGLEAPQPIAEADAYQAVCGLGSDFVPATYSLPLAPRATTAQAIRPTRLRYDATSGLLLVSDSAAPVLHAFALGAGGSLTALSALPTGVPLRDFVLTPPVPALAPAQPALQTPALPDPAAPTRRYVYAIEEARDGLVMSFAFEQEQPGAQPRLQPLLAPAPDDRFADRLRLQAPSTALAVIDTRARSSYVCGQESDAELEQQREALESMMASDLDEGERQTLERVEARLSLSEEAGAAQLRGVFVAATAADGRLTIIDVLDLDLACRARDACAPCTDPVACPAPNLDRPVDEDERNALAVRRHAARRQRAGAVEATISGQAASLFGESCPVSSRPALTADDGRVLVCVPKDPWATYNETWQVRYRGVLPGFPVASGALEHAATPIPGRAAHVPAPQPGQLTLHVPRGVDLCRRGVEVGDVVAVVGAPAERASECEPPTSSNARLLRVLEVFDDGVVVEALDESGERPAEALDRDAMYEELARCYPDQVGFEIRARDYLVTGTNIVSYVHRVVANEQGRCVIDESKDPRFTVRPQQGEVPPGQPEGEFEPEGHWRFENPYVSFTIALRGRNEPRTSRDSSVQVRNAATALTVNNTDGRIVDALPVTVRYLPEVGDLFVVDTASQGLRRYDLVPFEWDRSIYR